MGSKTDSCRSKQSVVATALTSGSLWPTSSWEPSLIAKRPSPSLSDAGSAFCVPVTITATLFIPLFLFVYLIVGVKCNCKENQQVSHENISLLLCDCGESVAMQRPFEHLSLLLPIKGRIIRHICNLHAHEPVSMGQYCNLTSQSIIETFDWELKPSSQVCYKVWFPFMLIWHEIYTETSNETGIAGVESQTDDRAKRLWVSAAFSGKEETQYVFCSSKDLWDWKNTERLSDRLGEPKTDYKNLAFVEFPFQRTAADVTNRRGIPTNLVI